MEELIKRVTELVNKEIVIETRESDDYGDVPSECHDAFGSFHLRGHCEPEDAIWMRDLQDNYYEGLKIGIRNTIKVLKEHPELFKN